VLACSPDRRAEHSGGRLRRGRHRVRRSAEAGVPAVEVAHKPGPSASRSPLPQFVPLSVTHPAKQHFLQSGQRRYAGLPRSRTCPDSRGTDAGGGEGQTTEHNESSREAGQASPALAGSRDRSRVRIVRIPRPQMVAERYASRAIAVSYRPSKATFERRASSPAGRGEAGLPRASSQTIASVPLRNSASVRPPRSKLRLARDSDRRLVDSLVEVSR
jgi:hypothetical protein